MSDQTIAHETTSQPALLLWADDYDRLMDLAQAAMARHPADDARRLLDELHRANIVPPDWMPEGVVTMNSYVEFSDDRTGGVRRLQLVYPYGADYDQGRISVLSPVGAALIGLAEGQSIAWYTRDGRQRRLTVLRVSNKPLGDAQGPRS